MKTVFNNAATGSLEFAKSTLYSFEVLVIGVVIPFLFLIGINTNYGNTPDNATSISKPYHVNSVKATVNITTFLSNQHS